MSIINNTYFKNDLFIPNAIQQPSITGNTPSGANVLNDFIDVSEKYVLLNSLGVALYNELLAELPITPSSAQKWKDLVDGVTYTDVAGTERIWEGLSSQKSLLAYYVYAEYLRGNSDFWTTHGIEKPNSENSANTTPAYKITNANHNFINKYQGGHNQYPNVYYKNGVRFVDYYGQDCQTPEVSLYKFLSDKKTDYGWDSRFFKTYRPYNTFGL